jgi:hypothetical protein
MKNYSVRHFIKKFEATHYSHWTTKNFVSNNGKKFCALGHCNDQEYVALVNIFNNHFGSTVVDINDKPSRKFPQKTPRARILAALKKIK